MFRNNRIALLGCLIGAMASSACFTAGAGMMMPPPLMVPNTTPPATIAGQAFAFNIQVTGGTAPYTLTESTMLFPGGMGANGTPCQGLMVNFATGAVTGTPVNSGTCGPVNFNVTDSSNPALSFQFSLSFRVVGVLAITTATLPNGTENVAYNQTVVTGGGSAPLSFTISAGALPAGLMINATTGAITGTPTMGGTFNFTVRAADSLTPAQAVTQAYTVRILQITTMTLPDGAVGQAYNQALAATGEVAPLMWTLAPGSGPLPPGLMLDANTGAISGPPSQAGTFNFTVQATDAGNPARTDSQALSIRIIAPLTINTLTLPNGVEGAAYNQTVMTAGGLAPVTFAVTAGALPPGFMLNAATGAITGPATMGGTFNFTITATDSFNPAQTDVQAYTVLILQITTAALPGGTVNVAYNQPLAITGEIAPVNWTLAPGSGPLPPGLMLDANTGVISGPPSQAGTFNFTVQATDSDNPARTHTRMLSIQIAAAPPAPLVITTGTLPNSVEGAAYNQTIMTTGGLAPVTFAVTAGALPPGVMLNMATGALTGPPNMGGTFNFTITATDSFNPAQTDAQAYTVLILQITTVSLPVAILGQPYAETLSATGDIPPLAWSLAAGSGPLPNGIALSASGQLNGIPMAVGQFPVTIEATDSDNPPRTHQRMLVLTVVAPLVITTVLPDGIQGTPYGPSGAGVSFQATGGLGPATFSFGGGVLPPGLNLVNGVLLGTPTQGGFFAFTIDATDQLPQTVSNNYLVRILEITTLTLPDGVEGQPYSHTLAVTGEVPPTTWALAAGSQLPPNLMLDPNTGNINGTPVQAGFFGFTVQATDSGNPQRTHTRALTLQITAPNQPPTASFTFAVDANDSLLVHFDASGSSDSDGTIVSYDWNFGDGSTGTGVNTQHAYATGGTFNAELTVTDNQGAVSLIFRDPVTVIPNPSFGLQFSAAVANSLVFPGDDPGFTYTVSNPAGTDAQGLQANFTLLTLGTFFKATQNLPIGWNCIINLQIISCDKATLAAGASGAFPLAVESAQIDSSATSIEISGHLTVANPSVNLAFPVNSTVGAHPFVVARKVHKSNNMAADSFVSAPGLEVTFTITVENTLSTGGAPATSFSVSDTLPIGFVFVRTNPPGLCNSIGPDLLDCPFTNLANGGSFTFEIVVQPVSLGTFENRVKAINVQPSQGGGQFDSITFTTITAPKAPDLATTCQCTGANCASRLNTGDIFTSSCDVEEQDAGAALGAEFTCQSNGGVLFRNVSGSAGGCTISPDRLSFTCGDDFPGSSSRTYNIEAEVANDPGLDENYTCSALHQDDTNASNNTSTVTVDGNEPPLAAFTPSCTDLICGFDAAASSDPDGTVDSFLWDLGDGTLASGSTVNHAYAQAGTFNVVLTVVDNDGATHSVLQMVTVNAPQAPNLEVTGNCLDCPGEDGGTVTVRFTVTELGGAAAPAGTFSVSASSGLANVVITGPGCSGGSSCAHDYTANQIISYDVNAEVTRTARGVRQNVTGQINQAADSNPADNTGPVDFDIIWLEISPVNPTINLALPSPTLQFTATQRDTAIPPINNDLTGDVDWDSSDMAVATIQTTGDPLPGLATALTPGTTTIFATDILGFDFTTLTVINVAPFSGPYGFILNGGTTNHSFAFADTGALVNSHSIVIRPGVSNHSVHRIRIGGKEYDIVIYDDLSGNSFVEVYKVAIDGTLTKVIAETALLFRPTRCEALVLGMNGTLVLHDGSGTGTHSFQIDIPGNQPPPPGDSLRANNAISPTSITPLPATPILVGANVSDLTAHPSGNYLAAAADGQLRIFVAQADGSFLEHASSPYSFTNPVSTVDFNPAGTFACMSENGFGLRCAPFDPATGVLNTGMSTSIPIPTAYITMSDLPDGRPLIVTSDAAMVTFSLTITGGVFAPAGPPAFVLSIAPKLVTGPNGQIFLGRLSFFTNTLEIHAVDPATGAINIMPISTTPIPTGFSDSWVFVWPQ